jgi:hypothetical protein
VICQCTVGSEKWDARDLGAPWCDEPAVTTIRLSFDSHRTVNVWVCQRHLDEYNREHDL